MSGGQDARREPRTVVVTGSASGIGQSAADLLRAAGDKVIGVDKDETDVVADLSTPEGRSGAVAQALELAGGTIDGVVACAGLASQSDLDVKVNFFGVVEFLQGCRPALARSSQPRAVVVSSIASLHGRDDELLAACEALDEPRALARARELTVDGPAPALYSGSKLAVARWVRSSAVSDEWAGAGITLNAVGPGMVATPMSAARRASAEGRAQAERAVPSKLGTWLPPEAIAHPLVWLVSRDNTHLTGQVIFVDGGAEAVLRGPEAV
ncbi:SDR family oxidoreductase [Nocardioides alcanivorans]|uniref:SDR family oxidoreductase n=1 Tax=Nocardioides alcanivorans TaxID=2897352 RepID=UPI001F25E878|nr:SDR family oxidoreductase [Nocardioides alcanivorans]